MTKCAPKADGGPSQYAAVRRTTAAPGNPPLAGGSQPSLVDEQVRTFRWHIRLAFVCGVLCGVPLGVLFLAIWKVGL
jgi:hypothetical protein